MLKTGKFILILMILFSNIHSNASPFNYELDLIEKYEDFYKEIKPLQVNNKQSFLYYLNRTKQCESGNQKHKIDTYLLHLELLFTRINNEISVLEKEKKEALKSLTGLSQIISSNISHLQKKNIYKEIREEYQKAKKEIEILSIYKAKKRMRNTSETIRKALSDKE